MWFRCSQRIALLFKNLGNSRGGSKPFIPSNNSRENTDVGRQEVQFYFTLGADGLTTSLLVTCPGSQFGDVEGVSQFADLWVAARYF